MGKCQCIHRLYNIHEQTGTLLCTITCKHPCCLWIRRTGFDSGPGHITPVEQNDALGGIGMSKSTESVIFLTSRHLTVSVSNHHRLCEIYWSYTRHFYIVDIVVCHLPGAPSYGGVRTWVEGSETSRDCALAEASNLLGYKTGP